MIISDYEIRFLCVSIIRSGEKKSGERKSGERKGSERKSGIHFICSAFLIKYLSMVKEYKIDF